MSSAVKPGVGSMGVAMPRAGPPLDMSVRLAMIPPLGSGIKSAMSGLPSE